MEEAFQQEKQELEYKNPNEDQGNFENIFSSFFFFVFGKYFHGGKFSDAVIHLHTVWSTLTQKYFSQHLICLTTNKA